MQIYEARIKRFRSLEDTNLENLPRLFLLFGPNGSGKSNILAAFDVIFSPKIEPGYQPGAPGSSAPFFRGLVTDFHHNFYRNTPSRASFEVSLRASSDELRVLWPQGFREGLSIVRTDASAQERNRISLVGHFDPVPEFAGAAETVLETAKVNNALLYDRDGGPEPWLPKQKEKLSLEEREKIGESLLAALTSSFSTIGIGRFLRRELFHPSPPETGRTEEETRETSLPHQNAETGADLSSSIKRRLFKLKYSQLQAEQDRFRRIRSIFSQVAGWGEVDFAQGGPSGEDLELMTYDDADLWLPVSRRGAGAEQLAVMIAEVVVRGARMVGIEELESNLDDPNKDKLFEFLEGLVTDPQRGLGQVMSTTHSSYYASRLKTHQKRFVRIDGAGCSVVEPWSKDRYAELFRRRRSRS